MADGTEASARNAEDTRKDDLVLGMSRRTLCLGVGGTIGLLALGGLGILTDKPGVRPPGGQDEDRLLGACIRCNKCMEVCPHRIVKPAHIEKGFVGMRAPELNFAEGWCDWCAEANDGKPLCEEVCPTRALRLPEGATPENTILGRAVIIPDQCLAYRLVSCRFCYDACPYEAMVMDEFNRPIVLTDKCNGCGACQASCVSLSSGSIMHGVKTRAIVVEPIEQR